MLKLAAVALVSALLSLSCAARPDENGSEGMMCFKQSDCMSGEVCLKRHSYDPNGYCTKGAF